MSDDRPLLRGVAHVERRVAPLWAAAPADPRALYMRAKVTANALRELDRFLNLLIDASAPATGGRARPGQRHTADKLRASGAGGTDHASLVAVGRARDCLFHCGGVVRRGDARGGTRLTLAWRADGGSVGVGEPLDLEAADLLAICALYRRIERGLTA